MPSILFVCSANMCRSPMAEALFKKLLNDRGDADKWRVESAGVWAWDNSPATSGAVEAMARRGIDLRPHRSRLVENIPMPDFDLILTMERDHKDALRAQFPALKDRIYLLTEMSGPGYDVRDPTGGSFADNEDTANELEILLAKGIAQIEEHVSRGQES